MTRVMCLLAVALLLRVPAALAEDWPQWLGPGGDSNWDATGIKTEFGSELPVKWRKPCGLGYAGPVVADGKVYLFDYEVTEGRIVNNPGRPVKLKGNERLHCLDSATGNVLWTKGMPVKYNVSYPSGPRATPCIDGQHIYTLGTEGDLVCRSIADGQVVWKVNFLEQFGTKTPIWGHSSCPLVIDNLVYCMVGGQETGIVAFDKTTGKEQWRALSTNEPGYAAPVPVEIEDTTCVAAFHPGGVAILHAKTGAKLWSKPLKPKYGMSIAVPRLVGEQMFVTAYGEAMMINGVGTGNPSITWKENASRVALYCSNASPYFADDAIFGCDIETSELMAIDPDSGKRLWSNQEVLVGPDAGRRVRHGTAFIVRHTESGRYFIFNEMGHLIVADMSREGLEIHGQAKIIEPAGEAFGRDVVWTHPAFAEGSVFARSDKEIVCVSLQE